MAAPDINASDAIFEWAERSPYAVAIIDGDRVVHYRTLRAAVLRAMAAFREAGWKPGDVVAISMERDFALQLAVSIALVRAGLAQVWLSPRDPSEYRAARARALGVGAVVTDLEAGALEGIPHLVPDATWLSAAAAPAPEDLRVSGTGRAMILIQSSGTTGAPKEIVVSHEEELLYASRNNVYSAFLPGERCMFLTGLRFWTGLTRALRCLYSGATVVAPPEKWSAEGLARLIALRGVGYLWCAPVHVQHLLEGIHGDAPRLPQLRVFRCSSAALPLSALLEAKRRIARNLSFHYGSNEIGGIAVAPPELVDRYPDCAGFPLPGIEVQVVDDDGQPVAAGAPGHVRVRRASHEGEWRYPGDVGVLNAEGVLFLRGRSDEVMNFDGIMVGPAEIETVLRGHPEVIDAAAFPLRSRKHESIPAAAVVLRSAVPLSELALYCSQRLGNRAPRKFYRVDAIPRSAIGKILRRRLIELAGDSP